MKRKEILPKWIRIFAWLHLLCFSAPIIFIVGLIGGEASFTMFGLSYSGSSLQPIAVWNTFIATLAAVVSYAILWGKSWAIELGVPYGYLAITSCAAATIIRLKTGGGIYIPLEPLLLIPFIIALKNNSSRWDGFDPDTEEQVSKSGKGEFLGE